MEGVRDREVFILLRCYLYKKLNYSVYYILCLDYGPVRDEKGLKSLLKFQLTFTRLFLSSKYFDMSAMMDVEKPVFSSSSSSSSKVETNLPWVEKQTRQPGANGCHEEIITVLNKLIDSSKLPHLLFYGPPGTGKTSTIVACAKKMYGPAYKSMALELNASDDRGIDVVRDQIKNFCRYTA